MSARTDIRHGRRGGNWLPDDYVSPLDLAADCEVCGGLMVAGQQRRHHLCDQGSIVGRVCTCKPGCTRDVVGDGATRGVACAADCEPCMRFAGVAYSDVDGWRGRRTEEATAAEVAPVQLAIEMGDDA